VGVHVGHVEISIVPSGDAPVIESNGGAQRAEQAPGEHEERWLQSRARVEWLTNRVQADDFND
jgi:hypothetical protein